MVRQKILALAAPGRNAARDLFDLHHLFFTLRTNLPVDHQIAEPVLLEEALQKVSRFDYNDFRDQVLPYLSEDMTALYENAAGFQSLRHQV